MSEDQEVKIKELEQKILDLKNWILFNRNRSEEEFESTLSIIKGYNKLENFHTYDDKGNFEENNPNIGSMSGDRNFYKKFIKKYSPLWGKPDAPPRPTKAMTLKEWKEWLWKLIEKS